MKKYLEIKPYKWSKRRKLETEMIMTRLAPGRLSDIDDR